MNAINKKTGKLIYQAVVVVQAIPLEDEWTLDADGRAVPMLVLDEQAAENPCQENFCAAIRYFDEDDNECAIEDIELV